MKEEMKITMNIIKSAEKEIGLLPFSYKREFMQRVPKLLRKLDEDRKAIITIRNPRTNKRINVTVGCYY